MKELMDTNFIEPEEVYPQVHTHVIRELDVPSLGPELSNEKKARIVKGYVDTYGPQGYLINSWESFEGRSFVVCVEIDKRNCVLVGCESEVIPDGLNVVKEYWGDEPNLFGVLNRHWQNDNLSIVFGPNMDSVLAREIMLYANHYKMFMPFLVLNDGEVS